MRRLQSVIKQLQNRVRQLLSETKLLQLFSIHAVVKSPNHCASYLLSSVKVEAQARPPDPKLTIAYLTIQLSGIFIAAPLLSSYPSTLNLAHSSVAFNSCLFSKPIKPAAIS